MGIESTAIVSIPTIRIVKLLVVLLQVKRHRTGVREFPESCLMALHFVPFTVLEILYNLSRLRCSVLLIETVAASPALVQPSAVISAI